MTTKKEHWEKVYTTKTPSQYSWTQEVPDTSLDFIHSFGLTKSAHIIDIGGGDSKLVDHLLNEGYENITVLDISESAIARAKNRLGFKAHKVNWVVSDITDFKPTRNFDIWHDRATFHFLTTKQQIKKYLVTASNHIDGFMAIGTFSEQGPLKCSGLDVKRYNEQNLSAVFNQEFDKLKCIAQVHTTPFKTRQHFLFCSFKKRNN